MSEFPVGHADTVTVVPVHAPAPPMAEGAQTGDVERLNKIARGCKTCMVVTHSPRGLHARPMRAAQIVWQKDVGGEVIFFVTSRDSAKVAQIQANPEVALLFSDDANSRWASISATATVVEDKAKARELWSPLYTTWFPEGPDTPGVAVVKAVPGSGSYWEGAALNKLTVLFSALRAKVTGKACTGALPHEPKIVVFPASPTAPLPGGAHGEPATEPTPPSTTQVAPVSSALEKEVKDAQGTVETQAEAATAMPPSTPSPAVPAAAKE